jgi:hypothetical protein
MNARVVFGFLIVAAASTLLGTAPPSILLEDDYDGLAPGMLSAGVIGAHVEYHYLSATAPRGNWVVSAFRSEGSQRAWRVVGEKGARSLAQTYEATPEERAYTHPMLVAGDEVWKDYTLATSIMPRSDGARSGVVVRYRHDRAHYFAGVHGQKAVLLRVGGGSAFRKLAETVLDERPFTWKPGEALSLEVVVEGDLLRVFIGGKRVLEGRDALFTTGRIGLTADVPTSYGPVRVSCSQAEWARVKSAVEARAADERRRELGTPAMRLWKTISTLGFGVGRNLRFGDLDGDGQKDILVPQVVHHGPKDRNSEVGCMTALTLEGKHLWQSGQPDAWKDHLTNDVGVQIHDLDGDGRNEVVYCRGTKIVVAEGATGRTRLEAPTPLTPAGDNRPPSPFDRILGDSLFFCDLRGRGRPSDIILKDRYWHLWALTDRLEPLWDLGLNTGHYPFAADVDADGRDELAVGYSLVDHDGKLLWSFDQDLEDHADGVAIVRLREEEEPRVICAASDEGMIFSDLRGTILRHHQLGHVQNPSTANYRDDLPGLETVSINFWGNQGIVHFFDADGRVYHEFEPAQHGSMMLPVNWTGSGTEYWLLSPNPTEGGLFDGHGRRVLRFPSDGHPDLAAAVLDLTGDSRDEIVVWDPSEIWIYTQADNPKPGRLYKPVRNPLFNTSNYQATVSRPGWSE